MPPPWSFEMRTLLITVGSTKFDALIESIENNLKSLHRLIEDFKITRLFIQHGKSPFRNQERIQKILGIRVEAVEYVNPDEMSSLLASSTVILSHAGAGTIFEVLRGSKAALEAFSVIPNSTLQDSHQSELIEELISMNCPIGVASVDDPFSAVSVNRKSELASFYLPEPNYKELSGIIEACL